MDGRPIPTYEEVRIISGLMILASLICAVVAGVFIRRFGREAAAITACFIWLSAFAMIVALTGDVMFSVLREVT